MFKQKIINQIHIQKEVINAWLCMLMDIYKDKGLCPEEEKITIKEKFLACARGRFIIEDPDLKYIDDKIELMFL